MTFSPWYKSEYPTTIFLHPQNTYTMAVAASAPLRPRPPKSGPAYLSDHPGQYSSLGFGNIHNHKSIENVHGVKIKFNM